MDIAKHKYTVGDQPVDQSCTGYLNRFFNHFDRDGISSRKARKMEVQGLGRLDDNRGYLLSEWSRAAYLGTRVHKMVEDHLNGDEGLYTYDESWFEPNISEECKNALRRDYSRVEFEREVEKRFQSFIKFEETWGNAIEFAASEYMIYGDIGGDLICGTIDALYWTNKEKREVMIVDWKTNKEIGGFSSRITNEASPKLGQMANNFDKYTCQVHVYKYLLEQNYKVTVVAGCIVHLTGTTYTIYNCPIESCSCIQ